MGGPNGGSGGSTPGVSSVELSIRPAGALRLTRATRWKVMCLAGREVGDRQAAPAPDPQQPVIGTQERFRTRDAIAHEDVAGDGTARDCGS